MSLMRTQSPAGNASIQVGRARVVRNRRRYEAHPRSTHGARIHRGSRIPLTRRLQTLWIMQSYLRDERLTKNPRSFQRIQRVLHRTHEIIFADISQTAPTPYSSVSVSAQVASIFGLRKVKPNAESMSVHPRPMRDLFSSPFVASSAWA